MPPKQLKRRPGVPVYQQIADHYAEQVATGTIAPGDRLPSAPEMARTWNVATPTAARAVAALRDAGVVETSRQGTFVRRVPPLRRRAVARYRRADREQGTNRGSFDADVRAQGLTPRSDVEVSQARPPARVAATLNVPVTEASVVVRKRRMYADDVPVQLGVTYIPAAIAAGTVLAGRDTGTGGMLSRLTDMGHAEVHIVETVQIRRASTEERAFLQLAGDAPVIEVWHTGREADGRPVEVTVATMPAYGWLLDYAWDIAGE
jgi:GntR family transcriptional regulator